MHPYFNNFLTLLKSFCFAVINVPSSVAKVQVLTYCTGSLARKGIYHHYFFGNVQGLNMLNRLAVF